MPVITADEKLTALDIMRAGRFTHAGTSTVIEWATIHHKAWAFEFARKQGRNIGDPSDCPPCNIEAANAAHLQALKLAKEVSDWERQVRIELRAGGKKVCTYVADFIVHRPNGDVEIHEYKGYVTELFKIKWRLLEVTLDEVRDRMWPGKEVRMELIMHR